MSAANSYTNEQLSELERRLLDKVPIMEHRDLSIAEFHAMQIPCAVLMRQAAAVCALLRERHSGPSLPAEPTMGMYDDFNIEMSKPGSHFDKFILAYKAMLAAATESRPNYEQAISALSELVKAAEPFIVQGVDGYAHLCFAKELISADDKRRGATNSPESKEPK